ncbi:hypothetical protein Kpol_520p42 [Vanderwaltozyma polyspora DSM 70294]|uniref:Autophagy-related protein 23 n=1 Tax=Vanderwaltozyma polyspora (strain ATCC 22028 / DSM 70294 / BCRC 21397 / CBS 2163 / NBRC 10782 / NRRL Y-8283 / UCD 57-17) TaxID=436907 RepID=ATG23_VANPO|nr:uncharacterized protein Kpol_520p42 [Vanderwaltozyma polyspora DSM 70294]A7TMC5.1 RecName: Full=Autophagy-related protein 23 [Vanderwaltozyma polyspora DSM 70294]EDO16619.1 hypothetical protein Kpol_520p42 [Vanderwaltozyma polyspora DSM 70294]
MKNQINKLDDILLQQQHTNDYLLELVKFHNNLLHDNLTSIENLNLTRKKILDCFNDLFNLNSIIINYHGDIKLEIKNLKEIIIKFNKLNKLEIFYQNKLNQWKSSKVKQIQSASSTNNKITINCNYQPLLKTYLNQIDPDESTLSNQFNSNLSINDEKLIYTNESFTEDEDDTGDEDNDIDHSNNHTNNDEDPFLILSNIKLLENCQSTIKADINQLEFLLSNYKKDLKFIENELNSQNLKTKYNITLMQEKLDKINIKRKKLLIKIGLSKNKNLTSVLDKDEKIIIENINDFINSKINSLNDQLSNKKENSIVLNQKINLWEQVINQLNDLENSLKIYLSKNKKKKSIDYNIMIEWINDTINNLNDIIDSTDIQLLRNLIENEKKVLVQATNELKLNLTPVNSKINDSISKSINNNNNTNITTNTSINNNNNTNENSLLDSSQFQSSKNPFPNIGTSPPKISISEHIASNNSFTTFQLNNTSNDKLMKNE